jgi:uncharacterized membrane protein
MKTAYKTAALAGSACLLLIGCEDVPDLGVEESPSIVTEEEAAEAENPAIFTAVGQEPGWILRIYDDVIVYEGDYGERRITANTPEVEPFEGGRSYTTRALAIEIREVPCTDVMSGAEYPETVSISEGGTSVQGCGGN